ncbi:hypothetical protein GUJ93_ZPchr0006g42910 [Zizania palustris]|uniref:Uncharacterized protein n=1 Tax=Zizania palustris TaxID=103762 RepID=A0A8J5SWB0_ZIZPA|nr:hypothetical protein GUJ93_ZPchr0006g42910 [Zizania palustris]
MGMAAAALTNKKRRKTETVPGAIDSTLPDLDDLIVAAGSKDGTGPSTGGWVPREEAMVSRRLGRRRGRNSRVGRAGAVAR